MELVRGSSPGVLYPTEIHTKGVMMAPPRGCFIRQISTPKKGGRVPSELQYLNRNFKHLLQARTLLVDGGSDRIEILTGVGLALSNLKAESHPFLQISFHLQQGSPLRRVVICQDRPFRKIIHIHRDLFSEHMRALFRTEALAQRVNMIGHLSQRICSVEPCDIGTGAERLRAVIGFQNSETDQGSSSQIGTETLLIQNSVDQRLFLLRGIITFFNLIDLEKLIVRRCCADRLLCEFSIRFEIPLRAG